MQSVATGGHPIGGGGELGDAPGSTKVRARGVERVFGVGADTVHAMGPLDVDVRAGEFLCIVGPSGCGKSTLLRIVAGLVNPSVGTLELHTTPGVPPTAMVFQDYGIFPWKTVLGNIQLGLTVAGVPKREAVERATSWMNRLGLARFANAYPETLSGGMRQRVSIARALALNPDILLMDEPFAALDAQMRLLLQDELLALWEADKRTVLFITHSLEEAILLGDRVLVMSARPGRIIADIEVPFSRPRASDIRGDREFAALHEQLWELLRTEVKRHEDSAV